MDVVELPDLGKPRTHWLAVFATVLKTNAPGGRQENE